MFCTKALDLTDDDRFVIQTPAPDELSAGIQTVEIIRRYADEFMQDLTDRYQIDCRPMMTHSLNGLRISLAIFNTKADIDYLVKALR
jgi:isopenicillin-N epimerase